MTQDFVRVTILKIVMREKKSIQRISSKNLDSRINLQVRNLSHDLDHPSVLGKRNFKPSVGNTRYSMHLFLKLLISFTTTIVDGAHILELNVMNMVIGFLVCSNVSLKLLYFNK